MERDRKKIEDDEEILNKLHHTECEKRKTAVELFQEANKRLKTAIVKKYLEETLVNAIIKGAQTVTTKAAVRKKQVDVMNNSN
ncbi:hypothetical protein PR048_020147 [Dryococelus australis]|uniref:Uncharacterized protein n=1 Tax=Dryococelus australis TaxID=614101 RepID=A0ABQ9H5G4_9NEOP|nr:hypothetical protein PR048_020147 [Dryococelus australis]